jgi:hypothetical protein
MHAIVSLAVRHGVPPSAILQWSESDFLYSLAALKLEHDEHRLRNQD